MAISSPKKYTVTAALIYANGPIHIGHLAGCYVPADIYVRYLRSKGAEVAFISGTDEHGVPITIRAKKEGLTPQQVVDKYYAQIRDAFANLGISFDVYSRTSLPIHHQTSQEFFTTLYNKGSFTEEITEQYFDETAQQFLADRYIVGTCPVCDNPNAYGDQCERCGSTLSPLELKDPRSMLSGAKPVLKSTKNWYLPLDKLQPQIETYVNGHAEWKSNVFGQCQSWLKDGLRPRAMTRDLDWGVPVPLADTDGKVLYVWFEAPIGYVSATRDWLIQKNGTDAGWENWWKNKEGNDQETKLVHFIGKDNIVFHCIIFPAMCMEEGSYILADNVPANEFMNLEGDKISTSRNWAVWLHEYLEDFPGKQDVLRYVLTANAPETKDSEFTWKDFQTRNNSELVGIFGNFINRAAVLSHKYCEGKVPARGALEPIDEETLAQLARFPDQIGQAIENYKLREALSLIMDLARLGNKYLADTQPWHVIKTDPDRVNTILNISLQIAGSLAIVSEPVMPFVSGNIKDMLSIEASANWNNAGNENLLQAGQILAEPKLLFEKIEDAQIEKQVQKLLDSKKQNELEGKAVREVKSEIQFDDFTKIDIRVATIVEAEAVPKSKKLLKLKVDIGLEQRTVLSGISEHFKPEEIIGQQVLYLANLAPRKMMGQESQGMILMAEDRDGSLAFVQPGKTIWDGGTVN